MWNDIRWMKDDGACNLGVPHLIYSHMFYFMNFLHEVSERSLKVSSLRVAERGFFILCILS